MALRFLSFKLKENTDKGQQIHYKLPNQPRKWFTDSVILMSADTVKGSTDNVIMSSQSKKSVFETDTNTIYFDTDIDKSVNH